MVSQMKIFYVLIEEWSVYVKSAEMFESQGGETQPWGKHWTQVQAADIEEARAKGIQLRDHKEKKK